MKRKSKRVADHSVEIGNVLLEDRSQIISEWEKRIVPTVDSAEPEHRADMRNHLPLYIDALGRDYSNESDKDEAVQRLAEDHGRQRFQIGWDIDEILKDYRVLQEVLIDRLIEKVEHLSPRDVQAVSHSIDLAVEQAVLRYREFQDASLHAKEQELNGDFEKVLYGVAHVDMTTSVRRANGNFARQLGYTADELVGKTIFEITDPEDLYSERPLLDSVINGDKLRYRMEKRLLDRRNASVWVDWSVERHNNDDGEGDYMIVCAHDISRRKKLGEQLEFAAQEAYSANTARRTFLRSVSHEFRTPLNAIIGMTKLAAEMEIPPKALKHLVASQESAEVLLGLINRVLAFANSGQRKLVCESFSLQKCVASVCEKLRSRTPDSEVDVACKLDQLLPDVVFGDEDILREILFHLTDNAVKFTAQGAVTVDAKVEATARQEVRVRFQVRDTGIGIAEEERDAVLEPFYMSDASNTREFGGVGLGLSISKTLVEELGGSLNVTTKPDQGSTFSFSLTFPTVAPESLGENIASPSQTPLSEPNDTIHVLLAEDVAANRNLVVSALEGERFDITVATDGMDAIKEASKKRFDVVLMDLQMPKLDGIDATRQIRQGDSPNRTTPIVAVTAMVLPEDRAKCVEVGMNDYLAKPIDIVELRTVVERWASQSQTKEEDVDGKGGGADVQGVHVMDIGSALDRLRGDKVMFCELASFYFDDYPKLLDSLKAGIEHRDAELSHRATHSLKGLVGTFSADAALVEIDAIRACVAHRDFAAAQLRISALRQALLDLKAALEEECE